jgi:hypothetical protein
MIIDHRGDTLGRVAVDFVVANNRDVVMAAPGDAIPDSVQMCT